MLQILITLLVSTNFAFAATSYTCDTKYDHVNIPHIETTSIEGYYYCFGLNHGKDRAWEMDFFRRVAHGRNAEVMGLDHLKSDLMMKLLDLPALGKKLWNEFPEDKKKLFQIYSDGVNDGFATGKNSQEFKDLGFEPEVWKPEDSLSVLMLQAFDQTRKTFMKDYDEELSKKDWGKEASELFNDEDLPWNDTILKEGEYEKSEAARTVQNSTNQKFKFWAQFPSLFGEASGSNNWVISSKKSKSKKAILANDPHLDLRSPLFWYLINIKTPEGKIMGASLPGVPTIASGTNGKVSWGLTNSYFNSADAVFVKDIKENQIETIWPTVKIKFWIFKIPFFFKSFERLVSGHRILPLESDSEYKIALRWTGFSLTADEVAPMFDLYKAQNVKELSDTFSKIGVPSWNFVFADINGEIGYRLVGKVFKHEMKLPYGMSLMNYDELIKEEYLSVADKPQLMNPARQYIYTANNRHWPSDSRYYGGRAYTISFRSIRIQELLQGKQDVENSMRTQCDRQVVDAKYFLPKIQRHLKDSRFENWDYSSDDSSTILPLYRRIVDLMLEKWKVNEYALYRILDNLNEKQTADLKLFSKTAEQEISGKNWGQFHVVNFPHLSRNDDWKFSPEIAGLGDTHSVDPGTSKWNKDRNIYEQNSGASMRMVIEMDATPKIWIALPGLNRHYDTKQSLTPWQDWKNCKFERVKF